MRIMLQQIYFIILKNGNQKMKEQKFFLKNHKHFPESRKQINLLVTKMEQIYGKNINYCLLMKIQCLYLKITGNIPDSNVQNQLKIIVFKSSTFFQLEYSLDIKINCLLIKIRVRQNMLNIFKQGLKFYKKNRKKISKNEQISQINDGNQIKQSNICNQIRVIWDGISYYFEYEQFFIISDNQNINFKFLNYVQQLQKINQRNKFNIPSFKDIFQSILYYSTIRSSSKKYYVGYVEIVNLVSTILKKQII